MARHGPLTGEQVDEMMAKLGKRAAGCKEEVAGWVLMCKCGVIRGASEGIDYGEHPYKEEAAAQRYAMHDDRLCKLVVVKRSTEHGG